MAMKKLILLFVTLALAGGIQNAYGQSSFKSADAAVTEAESIIRNFSGDHDADIVSIGPLLINFAKQFIKVDPEAEAALQMAKGLLAADFKNCSAEVKSRFNSRMDNLINSLGDLKLMEAREGDDNIFVIGDDKKISGLLIRSDDAAAIIKLSAMPEALGKLIQIAND